MPPRKGIYCVCSKCTLYTYVDVRGVEHKGREVDRKTLRSHKLQENLHKKTAGTQEVLANAVLVATVGNLEPILDLRGAESAHVVRSY